MLRYIWRTLRHYKVQTSSLLVGLLAIQLGLCNGLLALHQTRVSITEDITRYSRDLYDILVSPASEQADSAENISEDLTEPNYINKGSGGISLEDWKEIQSIPGIDIAAPVAALGYFTNSMDSLQIVHPLEKAIRFQIEVITSDGHRDYALGNKSIVAIAPHSERAVIIALSPNIDSFSGHGNEKEWFLKFLLPPIYNFLVAIDPESEARLVGLADSMQKGIYLSAGELETERIDLGGTVFEAYQIPVLVNAATPVPLHAKVVREELEITPHLVQQISQVEPRAETSEAREFQREVEELLMTANAVKRMEHTYDLSVYIKAFQTTGIRINSTGEVTTTSEGLRRIAPALEYYTTRGIQYRFQEKDETNIFQPIPTGVRDEQVQFHILDVQGKSAHELILEIKEAKGDPEDIQQVIFQLIPVGEVNLSAPQQNKLAKSPLGIYGPEEMLLEEEGAGEKLITAVELRPSVTPGTLQLPAAHGFTTLEAAELLKGEAPIDAVRVRVAGVENYDAAGQARIRRAAEEIVARTGLRVDIVAGSSPQQVMLDLPGYGEVEPLGRAKTWWLSLGAATVIEEAFSLFSSILVAAFIAVGLVFVHNRARIYLWQRREEVAVLHGEGWPRAAIIRLFALEISLLWLAAATLTLFIGLVLASGGLPKASLSDLYARWAVVVITGGLLFVGVACRVLSNTGKMAVGSEQACKAKSRPWREAMKPGGIKTMISADLSYYGGRLRPMAAQLVLGGALSLFAWLALSATGKQITPTKLGEFVYGRVGVWLAVIGLAALLLLLLTCLDSLLSYLDLRRPQLELLRQLGWRSGCLHRLILPQLLLPVILAALPAVALAGGAVLLIYDALPLPVWQPLLAALAFAALTIPLIMGWMRSFSQEPLTGGKSSAKTGLSIGIAAVILVAAAVAILNTNPGVQVNDPPGEGAPAEQVLITALGSETLKLTGQLAALGHRPAGSEANRREIDILCHWLEQAGLEVNREPVAVPPVRSLGQGSKLEVGGAPVEFTALVTDLAAATIAEPYLLQDQTPLILAAGEPAGDSIAGRLLILEAASIDLFYRSLPLYIPEEPLAVIGVGPGAVKPGQPVALTLEILEIIPGYHSENIRVDIPGAKEQGEPLLVVTNHGAIGPGASDNAGGASGAAVLARMLKEGPLPVPVSIIWTAGGDAQYTGGLARYLERHGPPPKALAVCRLGSDQPAIFGDRRDTLFGRPRDLPTEAGDLETADYIPVIDKPSQYPCMLWDLDYPGIGERVNRAGTGADMVTADRWMAAAETVDRNLKTGTLPAFSTFLGRRLLEAEVPAATYWRFAPYSNTKKDTLDRIDPEILGSDILFIERVLREVTGEGVNNNDRR